MFYANRSQPSDNQCCGWTGPCSSYYGDKTPSAGNFEEKKRFIAHRSWKVPGTPGATQRGHGERENLGVLLSLGPQGGWGFRVLQTHFIAEFKVLD